MVDLGVACITSEPKVYKVDALVIHESSIILFSYSDSSPGWLMGISNLIWQKHNT